MRILIVEHRALLWTLLVFLNVSIALLWRRACRASSVSGGPKNRECPPLLWLIVMNGLLFGIYYYPLPEDALISFRYARNLAWGNGLVWNPGERVEGYSNFLWVVVLAGVWRFVPVFDLPVLARIVSFFLYVLLIVRVFAISRKAGIDAPSALLVAWAVTVFPGFAVYSLSGLETTVFALLVLASIEQYLGGRWAGVALCAALAALCRLEGGILPVFFLCAYSYIAATGTGQQAATAGSGFGARGKWALLALAASNAVVVAYHVWRVSYYGTLVPNAARAKYNPLGVNRISVGAIQLVDFVLFSGLLLLLAAALYALVVQPHSRKRPAVAVINMALLAGVVALQVLGVASPRYRSIVRSVLYYPTQGPDDVWTALAVLAGRAVLLLCAAEVLWLVLRYRRARLFPLAGVFLLLSLFYVNAGGDWMVAWRYLTPVFPVGLVLLVAVIARLAAHTSTTRYLTLGVVGLNVAFALPLLPTSHSFLLDTWPSHLARNDKSSNDTRAYLDLQYRLVKIFGRDSTLVFAFEGAGAVPYYTNYRFVDTYGLTNRDVAEHCRKTVPIDIVGQAHSCVDWESVHRQDPDVVLQPTDPRAIDTMNAFRGPGTRFIAISRDNITMYVNEARVGLIPGGE